MKYFCKKILLLQFTFLSVAAVQAQQLPYQDTSLSFHERATDLVGRLTLAEKAQQMGNMVDQAVDRDDVSGTGRVTIPMYQYWNEALHGVARSGAATSFPESKGMSATWDKQLIFDCATIISDEARVYNNLYNKGLNYWCPTINMARDPRWGRDEENYGEDPFLAGQLAVQFIKGMQGNDSRYLKTVACAKHFAANNYEQGRQGSTSYMTKHNLREYYLPAFEMSVKEGKVKSIMSSYNALSTDINETNAASIGWSKGNTGGKAWGGKPNAMNDWLLTGILRDEWGFDGYVTSDCAGVSCIYRPVKHAYFGTYDENDTDLANDYAARATALAIKAGNDMNCEFKNRLSVFQTAVEAAISNGYMTEADLDQALIRVLETRFALGEFDASTPWSSLGAETLESAANQTMALKAAQESIVLLKNEKADAGAATPLLPISADKKVALIGPYANQIQLGDYSGTPTYTTTPFQAFAKKLNFEVSDGTIQAESFTGKSSGANGIDSSYPNELANTAPGVWFCYENVNFGTTPCKDFIMACAAKNTGVATVNFILDDPDGDPFLSVSNVDNNNWHNMTTVTATIDEANRPSGVHNLYVKFTGSQKYAGNYDYFRFYNEGVEPLETVGPLYMVQTSAAVNEEATTDMIARAVAVAQKADIVIFCGGTDYSKPDDHATGTESHDRWLLTMPGNQTAILQAIKEVNPNIVLVLETNSSMDITWEKANIPAIIEAWYGGQAQGQAICDIIYGDVNPSGKLTTTWYNRIEELPSASDSQFGANGMLEYDIDDWGYTYMYYGKGTGANVSRQAATPMYPFGYGLSYTTFAYSNPTIANDHVTFTITNTGNRTGAEVAQVYVSFPNSSVAHIQKLNRRLVGFERVELAAGQSKEVTIPINKDQLAYYNDDTDEWWIEGGTVNVYISASSADDRLTGSFTATAERLDRTVSGNAEPEEPITGISIPTADDGYILWNDANANISNATVENNGANIGSTGAGTVVTFAIGNSTKQDYVLTFKTGSKNEAKMLVTLTNKTTNAVALSKTVDILNTGNWTPSTVHSFLLSQLPRGNYELKMQVTEAASYAGNWGDLAFRAASDYDAIPGTLTLSKGTYINNGMRVGESGDEVGWIKNGSVGTYSFINQTAGTYRIDMEIKRSNEGQMNVKILDCSTGTTEVDYDYVIPSSSYGTPQSISLPDELTTGLKTMTLTFTSEQSGYICNYKAPTFTLVAEHQDEPEPVVNYESADIKANGGTIQNNTWSNGVYTMTTTSLDSYNQYFKMNGSNYTISLPADVVVSQVIFKECSNNYAGNDARLVSVTSEGATATIPDDNKFYHSSEGEKHDIVVTLANHTAGRDINFNLPKKGQPMCWIQLTIAKQNPGTAPVKTAEKVSVVNNHAVVAVTFDREIANDIQATINNTTVTAEGGSTTLFFPVWGLSYSTNYDLHIAAGAVTDNYGNSTTEAIQVAFNVPAKVAVEQKAYDYVVSTADELKAAIDAIDATNTSAAATRKIIFLKNGTYNLGGDGSSQTVQWVNAHNISFIGESKNGVIICGNSADISNPVLNIRYGSGQYMQDLTVRNLRDFDQAQRVGVSVAVYGGNKAIFKNVAMQAQQDTQVTGERSYAVDCDFYGAVDFLCGGGDHYYDQCHFYITNSGYITAPSTSSANKWGYVMQNCTIDKYVGSYTYEADGKFTLGRPWQGEPRNYWLNTTMNVKPSADGWSGMGTLKTHFYEYNSIDDNGDAIDLSSRVNPSTSTNTYDPVLTDEEAARFILENVLGGTDSWLPTDECPTLAAPVATLNGTTLSWTAVDDARCYVVLKDGAYLANVTTTSYAVDDENASYTVRAANLNGGLGETSNVVSKTVSVTTATIGWATACLAYDAQVPEGTKAYYISNATADAVTLTELTTIPAGEGFIFNAPEGSHEFQPSAAKPAAIDNLLVGTQTEMTGIAANSIYVLGKNSDNKAAMMLYTGTMLTAGKAYLPATAVPSAARSLRLVFGNEVTGISVMRNDEPGIRNDGDVVYNLQGLKLNVHVKKGVCIVNGKKVIY
jgi:beta-glucosidase